MTALDGWVTVPIRGQLDGIGPKNDIDDAGAYPLTISLRRDAIPDLLQQLVKATVTAATDEAVPVDHRAALRLFADQLGRAYNWQRIEELEKEDPDAAARHQEAAEELWPWLGQLPEQLRKATWNRAWQASRERSREHAQQEASQDTLNIAFATELRIPCPQPADPGRPHNAPVLRPEPLILRKNTTGRPKGWEDGWLIHNPNLEPSEQVWSSGEWKHRRELTANAIYRYTLPEAVAEAQRLAIAETTRYETWLAEQRAPGRAQR